MGYSAQRDKEVTAIIAELKAKPGASVEELVDRVSTRLGYDLSYQMFQYRRRYINESTLPYIIPPCERGRGSWAGKVRLLDVNRAQVDLATFTAVREGMIDTASAARVLQSSISLVADYLATAAPLPEQRKKMKQVLKDAVRLVEDMEDLAI